jgi:hypothetical protein
VAPEDIYARLYCARGQAENLIKLHKAQLKSDRTSCRSPLANQMRLILHTAAYWLMLTVRDAVPKSHALAKAEFVTLRIRLLKIGAASAKPPTASASPSPPPARTPPARSPPSYATSPSPCHPRRPDPRGQAPKPTIPSSQPQRSRKPKTRTAMKNARREPVHPPQPPPIRSAPSSP